MNIPYVKQYDENGELINPIISSYSPQFPTRSQRKKSYSKYNFFQDGSCIKIYGNNRKNTCKRKNKNSRLVHI
jgi:hypothetical protein